MNIGKISETWQEECFPADSYRINCSHMAHVWWAVQCTAHTGVFPLINCVFMYASAASAHASTHISGAAQNKKHKKGIRE